MNKNYTCNYTNTLKNLTSSGVMNHEITKGNSTHKFNDVTT